MKADVEQVIRDFKSVRYWNRQLITLNLRLEELEHALTWGLKKPPALSAKQLKSPYPMPSTVSKDRQAISWKLLEEKDECVREIQKYRNRILDCSFLERLDPADLHMLEDLHWFKMTGWDAAEKYGYSRKGMYKHLVKEIDKLR